MIKREELTNPASCMSRAREDEMTFVLLGRDAAAPAAIRAWAEERLCRGKNQQGDPQIQDALACAAQMETSRSIEIDASARAIADEDALLLANGWIWREGSDFWNHPDVFYTCTREHALHRIRLQTLGSDSALAQPEAITEEKVSATGN